MASNWGTTQPAPAPQQPDWTRFVLIGFAVGVLIVTCAVVAFVVFGRSQFVGPPVVSPDGRFIVRVTEWNCGATCSFSTTVRLSDLEQHPGRARSRTTILTGTMHPCNVVPRWEDDRTLVIVVHPESRITSKRSEWEGGAVRAKGREVSAAERFFAATLDAGGGGIRMVSGKRPWVGKQQTPSGGG